MTNHDLLVKIIRVFREIFTDYLLYAGTIFSIGNNHEQ